MNTSPKLSESDILKRAARTFVVKECMNVDSLYRAATQGYDVSNALANHLAGIFRCLVEDKLGADSVLTVLEEGSEEYLDASWHDRSGPRQHAFDVLDALIQALAMPMPDGWSISCSRIQKFERSKTCTGRKGGMTHEPRRGWCSFCKPVTTILVTIEAPIDGFRKRVIVVNAEPKAGA